jgi:hypothetical protein
MKNFWQSEKQCELLAALWKDHLTVGVGLAGTG